MFKPKGNMILVKQIPVSKTSAGGIILGTYDEEKRQQKGQQVGIVVELGPDAYSKESGFDGGSPYCKAGDVVIFPRYSGTQYLISDIMNKTPEENEVHYHLMSDTDVMGVMGEEMSAEYKKQRGIE